MQEQWLENKDDEAVRNYYNYKSSKYSDGNKNISYIICLLDKTKKLGENLKREEAILYCYYLENLNTSQKVAEET
ncbi:3730_t:CDS:1, partial [Gigaspora margarita]